MADMLKETLRRQRARVLASILTYVEREFGSVIPAAQMDGLRECVRSAVGVYHDLVSDLLMAASMNGEFNEHAVALLEQIHSEIRHLRTA